MQVISDEGKVYLKRTIIILRKYHIYYRIFFFSALT